MNFNLQCTTANKTDTYTSLKGDLKGLVYSSVIPIEPAIAKL